MQHAFNADVFIDIGPVNTLTTPNDAKFGALRRRCFR